MRSLSSIFCTALCLYVAQAGAANEEPGLRGDPLYRRYTAEDFAARPRHYEIAADREGRIFVANAEGVLHTNGQGWWLIRLPGLAQATSLALGRDGRMYVGGFDHVGVLSPAASGELVYQDLRDAFAGEDDRPPPGNVWQTLATAKGIWFRAEQELLFYEYGGQHRARVALPPEARSFYVVGDTLIGRVDGRGLVRVEKDRLEDFSDGAAFAAQPLAGVLPAQGGLWLIGGKGIYHHDGETLRHRPSAADELFAQAGPYEVMALRDQSIVVGTFGGEIQRYASDLTLLDRTALGPHAIEGFAHDREGGLWVATEAELLRLRLPDRWTRLDQGQGLRGTILASEWYEGALWLAGSRGIARMRPNGHGQARAEWLDWTEYEGYALLATASGLLIGHRDGVGVLEGDARPRSLGDADDAVQQLVRSRHDDDRVYARGATRIRLLQRRAGRWEQVAAWPLGEMSPTNLVEAAPDELWLDDTRGAPQRWRLDPALGTVLSRETLSSREGLPVDPRIGTRVHWLDDRVHVVSGKQLHLWDGERFVATEAKPFSLVERPSEMQLAQTSQGLFAFTPRRLFRRATDTAAWEPVRFDGTAIQGFEGISPGSDGVVRVSTWSGLLQFDATEPVPALPPLRVDVASVDAKQPDGRPLRWPDSLHEGALTVVSGTYVMFRFGVIAYEPGIEFRYRVPDAMSDWSDWVSSPELAIRARPGEHWIEVEARSRSGREIEPLRLRFVGQPRWHESLWARGLAALALLGAVALIAQWFVQRRTARYLAANRRLEGRIAERTRELEAANRRLEEMAVEDALTGVANRRALENGLQREWQRGLDARRPLAVLMIDVDHFKRYNDRHGHLEGDQMLRQVADSLRQGFDPQRELLARYGGEEFALLLPGTHLADAHLRAEEVRARFDRPNEEISVSIGVAAQVPTSQDEPYALLRRADAALYRAKRNGRNRVEVANE